jgi:hypothetical protein
MFDTSDIIVISIFVISVVLLVAFNLCSIFNSKEHFANAVYTAQPALNLPSYNIKAGDSPALMQVKENIKEQDKAIKTYIKNPDDQNVIEYGKYICYKKDMTQPQVQQVAQPTPTPPPAPEAKKCLNESLNEKFTYGPLPLDPFPIGYQKSWYDVDPADYYKVYRPVVAHMEDPYLKGYNLSEFNTTGGIHDVGRIQLNNNTQRYAQPNNYMFQEK